MKTCLRIDIEYDPAFTDPEGLAVAMDRLLETACCIPGVLDDYANPALGEFFVAEKEPRGRSTVVLNVSGGVVRDAFCSPDSTRVVLVDWDTEGQDATSQSVYQVETLPGRWDYVFATEIPTTPLDQLAGRDTDGALLAAGIDVEAVPAVPADPDLVTMCRRVAETAENWADCSDMKEALAVFKELGRDCRKLSEAAVTQADAERPAGKCDCEAPGYFCSGVPGILARVENGKLAPDAKPERCDLCRRYPTDEAARAKLVELGIAPGAIKSTRYVLYDFDSEDLATTTTYRDYSDAAADAARLYNVMVVALTFEETPES